MIVIARALQVGVLILSLSCAHGQPAVLGMRELPPFDDFELHQRMQRILRQMDAFHGDSAIMLINSALLTIDAAKQKEEAHYLLAYRAEVLYYEGLFNEAMRDLDEAERLARQLGDSTLIANAFNLKGLLHENIQNSKEALPYLQLALQWFPRNPAARYPVTELHHIHGNLGSYLSTLGQLDSARYHAARSLQLAEVLGAERAIAVAHWALGNIALKAEQPDSAVLRYDRSWAIADAAHDHDIGVDALVGRALALAEALSTVQARDALTRARDYLDAHRSGIGLVTQRNFARMASRTSLAMNDLSGALLQMGEWHRIDSTITANNIRSALATQAELLRADNDLEVERLERERVTAQLESEKRTRLFLIVAGLFAFAALTGIYLVLSARQRQKRHLAELQTQRAEQERTIAELRVREQVSRDLHDDLGVGLSALKLRSEMALQRGLFKEVEPLLREQAGTAEELIASMRHIIWALQDDQGSLDDLVAYIGSYARNYLDTYDIQLELRADASFPEMRLTTQQRRNLFLIVKEALHNVVKHAEARNVRFALRWDSGFTIEIADDGKGFEESGRRPHSHGLMNMRKRAEEIGAELRISSEGQGTQVRLHAPLAERKLA
ncbi:MAG: ATP-binding protein [Flavobacteriales bacterium]